MKTKYSKYFLVDVLMKTIEENSTADIRNFERRYDIDWLRILGILLVFIFHCGRPFDTELWHIKNDVLKEGMTVLMYFLGGAGMPIFFIIAGMGTFYALRYVKGGQYALNRVVRLLVPFAIGLFSHIPVQVYLEQVSHGLFSGTFFQFYRQMFTGTYANGRIGDFDIYGLHLWFLITLLVISLVTLLGTVYYSKDKNLDRLDKFTNFLNKPGMLYLLPIPIILFEITNVLTGEFIPILGGWSVLTHLAFFVYGYLFASNVKFKKTIEKHAIPALIVIVVCSALLIFLDSFGLNERAVTSLFLILGTLYSWSFLVCLFALFSKFMNRNNKARKFLNELVMPFYVIHQTIIVVLGFFIIQLNIHFFAKYIILILTSFTACVILLMIIKYLNPLRFIFGMRWKKGLLRRTKKEEMMEDVSQTESATSKS